MNKNDESIIVEETITADIQNVWYAITRIDRMKEWYFENTPNSLSKVGFETRFNIKSGGRNFQERVV